MMAGMINLEYWLSFLLISCWLEDLDSTISTRNVIDTSTIDLAFFTPCVGVSGVAYF